MGRHATFTHRDGAYDFKNQEGADPDGSLYIVQDGNVPLKQASVGIGMSGAGTFVVDGQPNKTLTFTPKPQYWIAFGSFRTGEVLDIQAVTQDAQINFLPGVNTMRATLNMDNTWTIEAVK